MYRLGMLRKHGAVFVHSKGNSYSLQFLLAPHSSDLNLQLLTPNETFPLPTESFCMLCSFSLIFLYNIHIGPILPLPHLLDLPLSLFTQLHVFSLYIERAQKFAEFSLDGKLLLSLWSTFPVVFLHLSVMYLHTFISLL